MFVVIALAINIDKSLKRLLQARFREFNRDRQRGYEIVVNKKLLIVTY